LKNTILVLTLFLTTNVVAQKNSFFSKTYPNSNAILEFGLGYLFNPGYEENLVKYQIASRNLFLNKKLGLMYTIESSANVTHDVFGLNYRFSNDFSFQVGSGLIFNSAFKAKGVRKEISIAYHPNYMPLTITTGYSKSLGTSLTVNYRLFFNKKKDNNKKDVIKQKSVLKANYRKPGG
jgi:hypothetical protein